MWLDDGFTCGESHLEEGRGLEAEPLDVVRRVQLSAMVSQDALIYGVENKSMTFERSLPSDQ